VLHSVATRCTRGSQVAHERNAWDGDGLPARPDTATPVSSVHDLTTAVPAASAPEALVVDSRAAARREGVAQAIPPAISLGDLP